MPELRVRNDEACALAQELARLTGSSVSEAVMDALRRRRDALLAQTGPDPELVRERVEQSRELALRDLIAAAH